MKRIYYILILLMISGSVLGQNERKYIRRGNRIFMNAAKDTTKLDTLKFKQAENEYQNALDKRPENKKWNFNLADAFYKQKRFKEATEKFSNLAKNLEKPEEQARAYHNLGNSQLMQKKLDECIESYKKALRKNPSDLETKYNLAFAQKLKKQQEQQQKRNKQQQKNKNKQNKDKNKNQQNKDKNKQNQQKNKNKDQQNKNQPNKNQQQQDKQKQQQQRKVKISKQDAEQLLKALENDERAIQKKVKKAKAAKARKSKTEKQW